MKKYFLLLTTLLFIGCQQPSNSIAVVQMDDDKTQAIQKMLENYLAYGTDSYDADYDQSIISEDLAGNNSIPGFEVDAESFIATDEQHHSLFENIKMWLPGVDDGQGGGLHTNYYDGKFDVYQRTYVITPKPYQLHLRYLLYQLNYRLNYLKATSFGTNTKFLTIRILNGLEIPLPKIEEQQKIASILSSVDDTIEKLDDFIEQTKLLKKELIEKLLTPPEFSGGA